MGIFTPGKEKSLAGPVASRLRGGGGKTPRSHLVRSTLTPLTENLDMISFDGEEWKTGRARFNPSFSSKNSWSLVPGVIEDVEVFAGLLRQRAGTDGSWGEVFPLEDLTTNLTIDIIGRAVLDVELNEQTAGPSRFKGHFLDQISRCIVVVNINTWQY
ncbi:Cytochrome P450 4V3 [Colletotrichum higginsianum IMI 349063]|uniref:Cytochrome P450 4V3 n=2 Tax=Colletotrichum higginsianum TaxID=80884 RepID=A0A1B7YWQ5_COLHI|nr:Cytochrome P450 4V3 [Colletotrichum higginsianum IMI 349063]OBR16466.1 Cytochrome P450 4V3 [Colletotrichum higginsianum IMI 349063]TID03700.1 putative sterigmatocystin biosynthesis P450 monooxygenase stcS [Colletotrichum higginsianum]